MNRIGLIAVLLFFLFFAVSCEKNNTNAITNPQSSQSYIVAFAVNSLQSKFLFNYTDINGVHNDTITATSDSIVTSVSTSELSVIQSVQCLNTSLPDILSIKAYMNGKSVSNSGTKYGAGKLVVGIQLQSLL